MPPSVLLIWVGSLGVVLVVSRGEEGRPELEGDMVCELVLGSEKVVCALVLGSEKVVCVLVLGLERVVCAVVLGSEKVGVLVLGMVSIGEAVVGWGLLRGGSKVGVEVGGGRRVGLLRLPGVSEGVGMEGLRMSLLLGGCCVCKGRQMRCR